MKKFLLGVAMFITVAVLCVVSAGAETYGDYEYTVLDDGTVEITSYSGSDTELEIPSQLDGKKVTSIGMYSFEFCQTLTSVTIPDTITKIGGYAFQTCMSLTSVSIPDSVTDIGFFAFFNCTSLKKVDMPAKVTQLGDYVFCGCGKLESIVIPEGATSVGEYAFDFCESLTSITIPDTVTVIDDFAFSNCSSLTSVAIPENVTIIETFAFRGCTSLKNVNIPKNVTEIGGYAFAECGQIESVVIPEGVTTIGMRTFYKCRSLKSVTFHRNITQIKEEAFHGCSSLKSVTLYDKIEKIGSYAFGYDINSDSEINKITDFVITCYEYSAARNYARNYGLQHKIIESAPENMTSFTLAGRASNAIRLSWNKNTTANGYILEQYTNGKWTRIAKLVGSGKTEYRITGLKAGTVHKFRMKAYSISGSNAYYSDYTKTLSIRTNPSNITGLKLGGRAADALRLNWTKNTSADGYIIEQYKDDKWVRIAKITSNATTTYRIAGLKASTQYKFRVKAYKMSGSTALYSGYTSTLSAYTNPSKVANLKITGKAGTALRLGWSKNTSADGYIIEMYSGGKWVRVAKITSNATVTYRKSGLAKGTTYKFRVRNYNMVGKTALYGSYVNVSGTTK